MKFFKVRSILILLTLLTGLSLRPLAADQLLEDYVPAPGEKDTLEVYLMIIGRGLPMYSWWGHIGIVIRDTENGTEFLYDYGNFSFEAEDFFSNFAMGRLWFQMMRMFASNYYDYIETQDRDLRLHHLNIPYARERALKNYLDWNNLPDNRLYLYHHYNDNCATRIRDLFDELSGGQLKTASSVPSGMSLRQLSRKYSWFHPQGDWIISFLLAGSCDRPVTLWQAMFLPDYLERFVVDFQYKNEQGNLVPFITDSESRYTSASLQRIPEGPDPSVWYRGLILGLILALPGFLFGVFRKTAPLHDLYRVLTGFLSALPGSILFFMMFFSDHDVTYGNWNILTASPLGLVVIPLTVWLWIRRSRRNSSPRAALLAERVLTVFFAGLSFLSVIALIGARIPGAVQNNLMIVLTFLPVYLAGAFRWEVLSGLISGREAAGMPSPSDPDRQ